MKKLSKFLLMGAALSGAMVSRASAFVDVSLTGNNNLAQNFLKHESYIRNYITILQRKLSQNYGNILEINIDDTSRPTVDDKDNAIKFAILSTLDRLMKTPILKIVLSKFNENTGDKIKITYKKEINSLLPTLMGQTVFRENTITIYGGAISNRAENGIPISFPFKPEYVVDAYLVNEAKNVGGHLYSLSQQEVLMGHAVMCLTHELGHIVHNTLTGYSNQNLGKKCSLKNISDEDHLIWLGNFYHEYESRMSQKLKSINGANVTDAWEKLKPSKYSKTRLDDRFAEDFAKAVVKGKDLGETKESKTFEEVLDKFLERDLKLKVKQCLTPQPLDLVLTF